jgi:membrane protein CcdC involved in cytochrome C biogenesis
MSAFMFGAIGMGFAVAGLFFLRFWRETHDRLFALFALAFFVLAVNRVSLVLVAQHDIKGDYLYWVRLLAFLLILVAIVDKNRSQKSPGI